MGSEEEKASGLPNNFQQAAADAVRRQQVTLDLDADLAQWLQAEFPKGWREHVNDLLRFFMDTSQARELEFATSAWEPGEMEKPPPSSAPEYAP